ncbi:MAG: hypothetical protein D6694_00225 [Gammaproteobacteria bacterium]|nr:MAG: hypothetical protein D6694_00225 [Gammaproteobacteria bacterium]
MCLNAAVEGSLDEAVVRRVAHSAGFEVSRILLAQGKGRILKQIDGYNKSARRSPWFVLLDLDRDAGCAPEFIANRLPQRAPYMCFRIAVREVEAWLLADSDALAKYLRISVGQICDQPELLEQPKNYLVSITRKSTSPQIKQAIVPRAGSGRPVGPQYVLMMTQFVEQYWSPERASRRSPSLAGCLRCLRALREKWDEAVRTGNIGA